MNNFHFHTDAKGKDLSKLINNYNLTILNDGTPAMADFATAPDLTLATTEMSPHTTWNPINQSCGSEHLPILIVEGLSPLQQSPLSFAVIIDCSGLCSSHMR